MTRLKVSAAAVDGMLVALQGVILIAALILPAWLLRVTVASAAAFTLLILTLLWLSPMPSR